MPPRPRGPFRVSGRPWWYAKFGGKRVNLHTADEAEAWRRFHRLQAGQELEAEPQGLLLTDLSERFLRWVQANRKPETLSQYGYLLAAWLRTVPSHLAAAEVRPHHVQACLDARPDWSSTTKNRTAAAAKRMYSWAVEQGLLDANPLARLAKAKPQRATATISPADWAKVVDDLGRHQPFLNLLRFLRLTGCRVQEARRIEARHVDHARRCVRFPAAEAKGGIPRQIVCPEAAWAILEPLAARWREGPVFRDSKDNPWTKNSIGHAVHRCRQRTGVKGWNARAMRHTFATEGLLAGENIANVSALLGHTSIKTTADVYSHLTDHLGHLRGAAERLAAAGTDQASASAPLAEPPAASGTPPAPSSDPPAPAPHDGEPKRRSRLRR